MSSKNNGRGFPVVSDVFTNVVARVAKKKGLDEKKAGEALSFLNLGEVVYSTHGNFTLATIHAPSFSYVGMAKRNPIDPNSPLRGRSLALSRAAYSMLDTLLSLEP